MILSVYLLPLAFVSATVNFLKRTASSIVHPNYLSELNLFKTENVYQSCPEKQPIISKFFLAALAKSVSMHGKTELLTNLSVDEKPAILKVTGKTQLKEYAQLAAATKVFSSVKTKEDLSNHDYVKAIDSKLVKPIIDEELNDILITSVEENICDKGQLYMERDRILEFKPINWENKCLEALPPTNEQLKEITGVMTAACDGYFVKQFYPTKIRNANPKKNVPFWISNVKRLVREVRFISRFVNNEAHVVQFKGFSIQAPWVFALLQEPVKGKILDAVLENPPLHANGKYLSTMNDLREEILKKTILGLRSIHAKGIIHGDLTPSNIMVDIQGDKLVSLKIIDFGESVDANDPSDCSAPPKTNEDYRGPDYEVEKKLTFNYDMWTFGLLAFTLYCGHDAFNSLVKFDKEKQTAYAEDYDFPTLYDAWFFKEKAPATTKSFISKWPAHIDEVKKHQCPELPGHILTLIKKCLKINPSDRPNLEEVTAGLKMVATARSM